MHLVAAAACLLAPSTGCCTSAPVSPLRNDRAFAQGSLVSPSLASTFAFVEDPAASAFHGGFAIAMPTVLIPAAMPLVKKVPFAASKIKVLKFAATVETKLIDCGDDYNWQPAINAKKPHNVNYRHRVPPSPEWTATCELRALKKAKQFSALFRRKGRHS